MLTSTLSQPSIIHLEKFELFETIDKLLQICSLDRFLQVVRKVPDNMGRLVNNRKAVVFLIILSLLLVPLASSRSIHQIIQKDIFPQGDFNDESNWLIVTQSGFSDLDAENTDATITDGKLSLTHQRSQNLNEMIFWSTNSNSGHDLGKGTPDGSYAISSGADIDLNLSLIHI